MLGDRHAVFVAAELGQDVAATVGDEARAVEALAALVADAVARDQRDRVRDRVADHHAPPRLARVELGCAWARCRSRSDTAAGRRRCRVIARAHSGNHWSQQIATPMRPTRVSNAPKPVSPGREERLLFVARAVGDVALAVAADLAPVGVEHDQAVVVAIAVALEVAHRQHDAVRAREHAHRLHRAALRRAARPARTKLAWFSSAAREVARREQLGQQRELRAARRRPRPRARRRGRCSASTSSPIANWITATRVLTAASPAGAGASCSGTCRRRPRGSPARRTAPRLRSGNAAAIARARELVVRRVERRHDHGAVAEVEVHVARGDRLALRRRSPRPATAPARA